MSATTNRRESRFHVILIRSSKYDDEGFVIRYLRGVLPSNTLATLYSLTKQAATSHPDLAGKVEVSVEILDDTVQKILPARIARTCQRQYARTLICMAGVQTNQFPRAAELAGQFRRAGLDVMLGGFHVSGAIALAPDGKIPPECQALIDQDITIVKGEVEDCWGRLLADVWYSRRQTFYDIVEHPDMSQAAIPECDRKHMRHFALPFMGTIDASRGCPYDCSFCTIVNVQGRRMRQRPTQLILEQIRRNWDKGVTYYFFTDDNFSRNHNWEEICDGLIQMREQEGIPVTFCIQGDTQAWKKPRFVEKTSRAGCRQIFIGMESVSPENLAAAGKLQNDVTDYARMVETWHEYGVSCQVGYIIGFPADTRESIQRDVRLLRDVIKVDQAAFFILLPLPGSKDYVEHVRRGDWMDPDYNRFDSFHVVAHHARMSEQEWFGAYLDAWSIFYDPENVKSILRRQRKEENYWPMFKNFLWYRNSLMEGTHPMITGFFRQRERTSRRPGFPIESRTRHLLRRCGDVRRTLGNWTRLYFEMQEIWLATRASSVVEKRMRDTVRTGWDRLCELAETVGEQLPSWDVVTAGVTDNWDSLLKMLGQLQQRLEQMNFSQKLSGSLRDKWDVLQQSLSDLHSRLVMLLTLQRISPPSEHNGQRSFWRRVIDAINPFSPGQAVSRQPLDSFWNRTKACLRHGQLLRVNYALVLYNFLRDMKLNLSFIYALATAEMV